MGINRGLPGYPLKRVWGTHGLDLSTYNIEGETKLKIFPPEGNILKNGI